MQPVKAYPDSTGALHRTVEEWQAAELLHLAEEGGSQHADLFANLVLNHADKVLAILTTGPRSRPSRRKVAGTTNPKKAARRTTKPTVAVNGAPLDPSLQRGTDVPAEPAIAAALD
jgi:hypothetical protein